jgi:hypothetical protein
VLPKIEDRRACFGRSIVGVRVLAGRRLLSSVDEAGGVVREPAGQGVVGPGIAEFGENALTKSRRRVSRG